MPTIYGFVGHHGVNQFFAKRSDAVHAARLEAYERGDSHISIRVLRCKAKKSYTIEQILALLHGQPEDWAEETEVVSIVNCDDFTKADCEYLKGCARERRARLYGQSAPEKASS